MYGRDIFADKEDREDRDIGIILSRQKMATSSSERYMNKWLTVFRDLVHDPVVMKRIYAVTLAAALFTLALIVKGPEEQGRLLTDSGGSITGIRRHSVTSAERYDVTVTVGAGADRIERNVTIDLKGSTGAGSEELSAATAADRHDAEIDAEIDRMLIEIEYSDGEDVELPSALADGTPVTWKARKQQDRTGLIFIPVMYIALVMIIIKSGMDSQTDGEALARKEIMKGLPRFCNQLFLMMNAGMILSDAFETICASYAEYGRENMTVFERELSELCEESDGHRISTATLISEYAARHNVKEMVRIATILTENERRGSDVIESLSRESKYLWDDRKIVARESGKMIDMKMSWPLGMLLILLIVITMAPALLSM